MWQQTTPPSRLIYTVIRVYTVNYVYFFLQDDCQSFIYQWRLIFLVCTALRISRHGSPLNILKEHRMLKETGWSAGGWVRGCVSSEDLSHRLHYQIMK